MEQEFSLNSPSTSNIKIDELLYQKNYYYSVKGFGLISSGENSPFKSHSFVICNNDKIEKKSVEKNKPFNKIELDDSQLKEKLNFQNSSFICKDLLNNSLQEGSVQIQKIQPFHQFISIKFDLWTKENNEWFQVDCPIKDCLELKFNPFNVGPTHHGRKKTENPYLSLIFKCNKTDFLKRINESKNPYKKREISIYLQVTLTNDTKESFIDYIEIPFRKRKKRKLMDERSASSISNSSSVMQSRLGSTGSNYLTFHNFPYFLSSITPSEGNSGDIVSLEGKFPPQGQFQIIFGTAKIEPAFYFENKLQCVVPDGIPGNNALVFIIYNNQISEFHTFNYKNISTQTEGNEILEKK